jgi:hypothetical protein
MTTMRYPPHPHPDEPTAEEREWFVLFSALSDAPAPHGLGDAVLARWRAESVVPGWLALGWVRTLVAAAVGLGGGGVYLAWLLRGVGATGLRALNWSHALTQGVSGMLGLCARVTATWEAMAEAGLAIARVAMRPESVGSLAAALALAAISLFLLQRLLVFQRSSSHA